MLLFCTVTAKPSYLNLYCPPMARASLVVAVSSAATLLLLLPTTLLPYCSRSRLCLIPRRTLAFFFPSPRPALPFSPLYLIPFAQTVIVDPLLLSFLDSRDILRPKRLLLTPRPRLMLCLFFYSPAFCLFHLQSASSTALCVFCDDIFDWQYNLALA